MDESIVEPIERNRREESGFRKPMGGNDHWGSRLWRTKSSSTLSGQSSARYGKRAFWASATDSGPGAVSMTHWMRCRGDCAQEGEVDFGSGYPILFRQTPAQLAGPVCGTSDWRSTHGPPDPEVAQSGRHGTGS